jgi:Zn-dependent protease with chaperone function
MTNKEIKLSSEFKTQTTKAIFSIVLFAFIYIFLLLSAAGLTALCIYGGVMLIVSFPRLITIVLGIGLGSLGILILIFLLKFIFKSHKVDRTHLYEIKKEEEPEFFILISEIVEDVKTSFPKKIYLSADVNAAVFYDSNLWSMIFPIKKNLQVGLGLVNTVSREEFKAILSHEFGHFSQKTMKVGSYVYNVNQVIFNMIYENDSYDKLIQSWSNISGYFSFFVMIAVKIIQGIQWILKKMYDVVNRSYMGLSREMEFHADEIAASVTGYEPLKSSLLRLALADHSFNSVLAFYEGKIADNLKSKNIYQEQLFIMNFLAKDSDIPIINGLPGVSTEDLNRFDKSKLVIKDQWASHPSTEERIDRLENTGFESKNSVSDPANTIFKNIEKIQKELTDKVFEEISYQGEVTFIPIEQFQKEFSKEYLDNSFSKVYNGYYDNKNPVPFEFDTIKYSEENIQINELFSDDKVDMVYTSLALQNDIEILKQIVDKTIPVKTFDYDGKKFKRKESKGLVAKLGLELQKINDRIKQNDIRIFNFFYQCEQSLNNIPQLKLLYQKFFELDKIFDSKYELYTELSNELQFLNFTTPFEQIKANFLRIETIEQKLKNEIKKLLADSAYESEMTKEIKDNFELYLTKNWQYFGSEQYFDNNLEILFSALNNYAFLLSRRYFLLKKKLLDYQEGLIRNYTEQFA